MALFLASRRTVIIRHRTLWSPDFPLSAQALTATVWPTPAQILTWRLFKKVRGTNEHAAGLINYRCGATKTRQGQRRPYNDDTEAHNKVTKANSLQERRNCGAVTCHHSGKAPAYGAFSFETCAAHSPQSRRHCTVLPARKGTSACDPNRSSSGTCHGSLLKLIFWELRGSR